MFRRKTFLGGHSSGQPLLIAGTLGLALVLVLGLAVTSGAKASLVQKAEVRLRPTVGHGNPKGGRDALLSVYLSTRDAASRRGTFKPNPAGQVFVDLPKGTTVNRSAVPTCIQSEYASPSSLAASCARSVVGSGWALVNKGDAGAVTQLAEAPGNCAPSDIAQYQRTYEKYVVPGVRCTPLGYMWVRLKLYQGAVLRNSWWCYGYAGAPRAGAPCNATQSGGEANGLPFNAFNDLSNASSMNGCNLILAAENGVSPMSIGAVVNQCSSRVSIIIPAVNGTGAGLGELAGGYVATDIAFRITNPHYLHAGPCLKKRFEVVTRSVYSRLKGESANPQPAENVVKFQTPCS